jgi:hypothetical protein
MNPIVGSEVYKMAQQGEGGYTLTAKSWNDYERFSKRRAMKFKNIPTITIKFLKYYGFIKVYLKNGRLKDMVGVSWTRAKVKMNNIKCYFLNTVTDRCLKVKR